MKNLLRKVSLRKYPRTVLSESPKEYLVIYTDRSYDVISEFRLKYSLLHPDKKKSIHYIFDWNDRIDIESKFEEGDEE